MQFIDAGITQLIDMSLQRQFCYSYTFLTYFCCVTNVLPQKTPTLCKTATINNHEPASYAIAVSKYINARVLHDTLQALREEKGTLYFYPVDDNKYCIKLEYVQHTDAGANTAKIYEIEYLPGFFDQFDTGLLNSGQPFSLDKTTQHTINICSQTEQLLLQLQQQRDELNAFASALQLNEIVLQLLRRALQSVTIPFAACQVPACRFLAIESEREKIYDARQYLEAQYRAACKHTRTEPQSSHE